jgi:hypothetical protein
MDRQAEAQTIIDAVLADNFVWSTHAGERALERGISTAGLQNLARTYTEWRWQEAPGTHLFKGLLLDGKGGGFSAKLDGSVVVVTVFKRKLKKARVKK